MSHLRTIGLGLLLSQTSCAWLVTPDPAGPFHGIFVKVDVDQDGFISPEELQRTVIDETPFDALDRNGDGRVGEAELTSRLFTVDPSHFDATLDPVPMPIGKVGAPLPPEGARHIRELYHALRAEIVAVRGQTPGLPSVAELDAAAASGNMGDAPMVRHRLVAEALAAGLVLPTRLHTVLTAP